MDSIFIIDSKRSLEHVDVGDIIADKFESTKSETCQKDDEKEG